MEDLIQTHSSSTHLLKSNRLTSPVPFTFRKCSFSSIPHNSSSYYCRLIIILYPRYIIFRKVLTTYLLYINVITQSGRIDERVIPIQTFQPITVLSKGEDTLYLGEGDSIELPLYIIYGNDETGVTASVQVLAGRGSSLLSNQTGIPLSPHTATKTSILLTVRFLFIFDKS